MATLHSSPSHALTPQGSPLVRPTRRSPGIQELQSAPKYVDIYTGSPLGHFLRFGIPSSSSAPFQPPSTQILTQLVSHGHPDPPQRWTGPRGFGARHVNDDCPFSLWSEERQDFRNGTKEEKLYICSKYDAERIEFHGYLIVIETANPPTPIPLTVACKPAIFVPPGQTQKILHGDAPYANPRIPDPCPQLTWKKMETPRKSQMADVIDVLENLVKVRRVNFLPDFLIVELVHGDGHIYPAASLPAKVAGFPTSYHHDSVSFFSTMRDHTRERLLDPGKHLPGPRIGPLPQDGTNYLREPSWGLLNPGVRVSTGSATDSGANADAVQSTTCGIRLRKGATDYVTVANHGFLAGNEVFHPMAEGDKIGDVVRRYPELDVAMVQLTPAHRSRFTNQTYFQAEPPKRIVETDDLVIGTWFEVDGMSTGMLLSFEFLIRSMEKPVRPPGHPKIPVLQWKQASTFRIFGAANPQILDGICGAPFVEVETGNVGGFFHLANGDWAECAALDDLVAEGWEVS